MLVSVHERLHHVLQTTTPWGLLVTACIGRFVAGTRPPLVAGHVAEGCRLTHEAFATYFSVSDDPGDRALLEGNPEYEAHHQTAAALAPARLAWPERSRIVDALLRAAMSPAALVAIEPNRLATLRTVDIPEDDLPDRRLQRIQEFDTESITHLLAEAGGSEGLVRFRDAVANWLTGHGVPTATWEPHRAWVQAVVAEVNQGRPAGAPRIEADGEARDPLREAADDQQRERLRLHDQPLPLEVVDARELSERGRDFARSHVDVGPHLLVVWWRADLFRRQFVVPEPLRSFGGHVFGLLSCDRTHGEPRAMLCPIPRSPAAALPELGTKVAVLFVTTLASIVDTDADVRFSGAPLTFALIDQPILGFVDHTVAAGATLRWEPVWIDGDHELSVYVFVNEQLPGILFLHVATSAGRFALSRWLRTLPADQVVHDPALGEGSEHAGRLHAVMQHLVGTLRELDQFGGRTG